MNDRDFDLNARLGITKGDTSGAEEAFDFVDKKSKDFIQGLRSRLDGTSKSLGVFGKRLGDQFSKTRKPAEDVTQELREQGRQIKSNVSALEQYERNFRDTSDRVAALGDADSGLGAVRGLLEGATGQSFGGLTIAQDLLAAQEGLPRFGTALKGVALQVTEIQGLTGGLAKRFSSLAGSIPGVSDETARLVGGFGSMAAAAGLSAIAIIGISAAMDNFNRTIEGARNNLLAEIDVRRSYLTAVQQLTSEQARAEVDSAQQRLEVNRQLRDEIQAAVDAGRSSNEIAARFGDIVGAFTDVNDVLAELNKDITTDTATINTFSEGIKNNAFAANDAIVAEKALADERKRAAEEAQKLIDDQARQLVQINRQIAEGISTEEAEQRIERLNALILADQATLEELGGTSNAVADELKKSIGAYQREILQLQQAIGQGKTLSEEQVEALKESTQVRKEETDAVKSQSNALQNVISRFQENLKKAVAEETERREKLADLKADLDDKEADAQKDIQAAIDDADKDRKDALDANFREQLAAEQRFEQQRANIRRTFRQAQNEAERTNSVQALIRAREQRKQDIDALKRDKKTEDDQRAQALLLELQQIDEARNERIASINAELNEYRASYAQKVAEINTVKATFSGFTAEAQAGIQNVQTAFTNMAGNVQNAVQSIFDKITNPTTLGGTTSPYTTPPNTANGFFNTQQSAANRNLPAAAFTGAGTTQNVFQIGQFAVGEIATPAQIETAKNVLVQAMAQFLQIPKGKSS